uniref:Striatin-3 n=1 Tax=Phallusia mammillata TaxID=59560 RepID=A0A6F9DUW4_9ASCI|nr:striatin-3 [Phallusia mammillata]
MEIDEPSGTNSQGGDSGDGKPTYSMPGILHFIQHEWSRFEMERAQWDVERAELQARIAFLQGERKGQENLKRDLIRRIKMLEFALKQERAKVHKLRFGNEMSMDQIINDANDDSKTTEIPTANANMSWRHGRQLLRQYLQEVGYSDTILDVRSQRVKALLGNNYDMNKPVENDNKMVNGDMSDEEKAKNKSGSFNIPIVNDQADSEVLHDFDFLNTADNDDDDVQMQDEDVITPGDHQRKARANKDEVDGMSVETATAIAEFDFLNPDAEEPDDTKATDWTIDPNKLNAMKQQFLLEKKQQKKKGMKRPAKKHLQDMLQTFQGAEMQKTNDDIDIHIPEEENLPFTVGGGQTGDESIETALGLGALAGLTVANEADPLAYDMSATKETFRKTWSPKFTLRSHFDGIRAIRFLPTESAVLTASEDNTMKLWNLNKPLPNKKSLALDVEPIYSFRGHVGAVLCLDVSADGVFCFSGGIDSSVRCWALPNINIDAYDTYDSSLAGEILVGHTDAVWSLSYSNTRQQLLSASADNSIKLWRPTSNDPLVQTYTVDGPSTPTCVEFVQCDSNHAVVSHTDGKVVLYDLETGKTPVILSENDTGRVNAVATHPTMPITMTAHDDRHIKFFDNSSGKLIHSMVAHLDSVTSLSVDPNGLYLLSGSHDSSIRLWNLDSKTCIQELTSHRKKFDESIYSVAFHPSATYIASAGADALAKVFV